MLGSAKGIEAYTPNMTFQMISTIDSKLAGQNVFFDEEAAHERQRQNFIQRAALAQKNMKL